MKKEASFTLIELLVVIGIIGLITTLILLNINVSDQKQKTKIAKTLELSQSVQSILGHEARGIWEFDNNALDSSGYGNSGTLNNFISPYGYVTETPQRIVSASLGQGKYSLSFDGADDNVAVTSAPSFVNIFDNGGTALAWVYPVNDGEVGSGYIIGKIDVAGVGWNFAWSTLSGGKLPLFFNQNFGVGNNYRELTNAAVVPINQWSLVGITYNNSSVNNRATFYLNGVVQPSSRTQTPTGTRQSDIGINMIIGNNLATTRTFNGYIDEVRIYAQALTLGQIQRQYAEGLEKYAQSSY
ncbi:MAG: hypothetical protein A3A08_02505 [Candidatus Nealsonbacteria bacterium RIFCSPLOWO2_01_FULL_41_9]|uniref:LamG-like jellyroll fold domain-containing protein n=1 Tax=Candidatus Nealsonbacteria bacterium RIFCSPLOWO2_01_FULL_41_9 TaxID=1801671 RepID=A0A1G2EAL9_9BACT|nr:MAG: hypothetical protein A3A08_02505 [Candidatus Nealsonbacteria bacterium RIFCSPLOWO2_01_FULL_41_9]